jgi:hypothetical protein
MPRARALLTLLVAFGLLLAGCGGGEEPATVRSPAVRLVLDDFSITPQEVHVRPSERLRFDDKGRLRLKLVATNRGRLTHNVRIQLPPKEPGQRPEAVTGTEVAQPGERVEEKVRLRPGTYRLICTLANHDDLGQFGKLVVHGT